MQQTFLFRWIFNYYSVLCLNPYKEWSWKSLVRLLFGISRLISFLQICYLILLVLGVFRGIHGDMEVFGYIEAFLWIAASSFYGCSDYLFFSKTFRTNLEELQNVMEKVLTSSDMEVVAERGNERFQIQFFTGEKKTIKLFLLFFVLDCFQMKGLFVAFYDIVGDRMHLYSIFPWKSFTLQVVDWMLESSNMSILILVISLMLVLPGTIAFYLEECLNQMTKLIRSNSFERKENIDSAQLLSIYQQIFFIAREVNKRLGMAIFFLHVIISLQQLSQTYCVFQLLRSGATYTDLEFFFVDILLTIVRLAASFNALSVVDRASSNFRMAIKNYTQKTHYSFSNNHKNPTSINGSNMRRKFIERKARSLRNVSMNIGPCKCNRDLVLVGMSVYLNYYATAALWP
ncbi:unnamed protein product [Orchesella dallaii]|uniref:Gustatory receptor n=1 Tax=Orchesella dallaii TaxID=48710 RepID=A0ABP1RFV0_9HEXA